jgi:tRNA/tmRNA/rRNA uracil-C5-methylase (TrmA/RlmC/RlmD family)
MEKFVIEFEINNDAFVENRNEEIARILNVISSKIKNDTETDNVWDYYGNIVGTFGIEQC